MAGIVVCVAFSVTVIVDSYSPILVERGTFTVAITSVEPFPGTSAVLGLNVTVPSNKYVLMNALVYVKSLAESTAPVTFVASGFVNVIVASFD